jgi:hypothetical protein
MGKDSFLLERAFGDDIIGMLKKANYRKIYFYHIKEKENGCP